MAHPGLFYYCQVCQFELEGNCIVGHLTSEKHKLKKAQLFQKEVFQGVVHLKHIDHREKTLRRAQKKKTIGNKRKCLSMVTLYLSSELSEEESVFYLCHVCEQSISGATNLRKHLSKSNKHCHNHYSNADPDVLRFSWIQGKDLELPVDPVAHSKTEEDWKLHAGTLQVLDLPPDVFETVRGASYVKVMDTLSQHDNLLKQTSAARLKQMTIQTYLRNPHRKHPLLGLEHLVECSCEEQTDRRLYLCTVCKLTLTDHKIVNHLLGFHHIHGYINAWHPSTLKLKNYYEYSTAFHSMMQVLAKRMEEIHGTTITDMKKVILGPALFSSLEGDSYVEALKKLEILRKIRKQSSLLTRITSGDKLVPLPGKLRTSNNNASPGPASVKEVEKELASQRSDTKTAKRPRKGPEMLCLPSCQVCDMKFETILQYFAHVEGWEHKQRMKTIFVTEADELDYEPVVCSSMLMNECRYINREDRSEPIIGLLHIVTCVTNRAYCKPLCVCIVCQRTFPAYNLRAHLAHPLHIKHTLMHQNPAKLPFAWKGSECEDVVKSLAWEEEKAQGPEHMVIKIIDLPSWIFILFSNDFSHVCDMLDGYFCYDWQLEVPKFVTVDDLLGSHKSPHLGLQFMVCYKTASGHLSGSLCLLCERILDKVEVSSHVFSLEHIKAFLHHAHPGSLDSEAKKTSDTLLDLAKQAAEIHPTGCIQRLTNPVFPYSYKEAVLILQRQKKMTGQGELIPVLPVGQKLVPTETPKETDKGFGSDASPKMTEMPERDADEERPGVKDCTPQRPGVKDPTPQTVPVGRKTVPEKDSHVHTHDEKKCPTQNSSVERRADVGTSVDRETLTASTEEERKGQKKSKKLTIILNHVQSGSIGLAAKPTGRRQSCESQDKARERKGDAGKVAGTERGTTTSEDAAPTVAGGDFDGEMESRTPEKRHMNEHSSSEAGGKRQRLGDAEETSACEKTQKTSKEELDGAGVMSSMHDMNISPSQPHGQQTPPSAPDCHPQETVLRSPTSQSPKATAKFPLKADGTSTETMDVSLKTNKDLEMNVISKSVAELTELSKSCRTEDAAKTISTGNIVTATPHSDGKSTRASRSNVLATTSRSVTTSHAAAATSRATPAISKSTGAKSHLSQTTSSATPPTGAVSHLSQTTSSATPPTGAMSHLSQTTSSATPPIGAMSHLTQTTSSATPPISRTTDNSKRVRSKTSDDTTQKLLLSAVSPASTSGSSPVGTSESTRRSKSKTHGPAVGLNFLVCVMYKKRIAIYCQLCEIKAGSKHHRFGTLHRTNYVRFKRPELTGPLSDTELLKIATELAEKDTGARTQMVKMRSERQYEDLTKADVPEALAKIKAILRQQRGSQRSPSATDPQPESLKHQDMSTGLHDEPSHHPDGDEKNQSPVPLAAGSECSPVHTLPTPDTQPEGPQSWDDQLESSRDTRTQPVPVQDTRTRPVPVQDTRTQPVAVQDTRTQPVAPKDSTKQQGGPPCSREQQEAPPDPGTRLQAPLGSGTRPVAPRYSGTSQRAPQHPGVQPQDPEPPMERRRIKVEETQTPLECPDRRTFLDSGHYQQPVVQPVRQYSSTGELITSRVSCFLKVKLSEAERRRVVGLSSVLECLCGDKSEKLFPFYMCRSCKETVQLSHICGHITSIDHQLKYMWEKRPSLMAEISNWKDWNEKQKMGGYEAAIGKVAEWEQIVQLDAEVILLDKNSYRRVQSATFSKGIHILEDIWRQQNETSSCPPADQQPPDQQSSREPPHAESSSRPTEADKRRDGVTGDKENARLKESPIETNAINLAIVKTEPISEPLSTLNAQNSNTKVTIKQEVKREDNTHPCFSGHTEMRKTVKHGLESDYLSLNGDGETGKQRRISKSPDDSETYDSLSGPHLNVSSPTSQRPSPQLQVNVEHSQCPSTQNQEARVKVEISQCPSPQQQVARVKVEPTSPTAVVSQPSQMHPERKLELLLNSLQILASSNLNLECSPTKPALASSTEPSTAPCFIDPSLAEREPQPDIQSTPSGAKQASPSQKLSSVPAVPLSPPVNTDLPSSEPITPIVDKETFTHTSSVQEKPLQKDVSPTKRRITEIVCGHDFKSTQISVGRVKPRIQLDSKCRIPMITKPNEGVNVLTCEPAASKPADDDATNYENRQVVPESVAAKVVDDEAHRSPTTVVQTDAAQVSQASNTTVSPLQPASQQFNDGDYRNSQPTAATVSPSTSLPPAGYGTPVYPYSHVTQNPYFTHAYPPPPGPWTHNNYMPPGYSPSIGTPNNYMTHGYPPPAGSTQNSYFAHGYPPGTWTQDNNFTHGYPFGTGTQSNFTHGYPFGTGTQNNNVSHGYWTPGTAGIHQAPVQQHPAFSQYVNYSVPPPPLHGMGGTYTQMPQ